MGVLCYCIFDARSENTAITSHDALPYVQRLLCGGKEEVLCYCMFDAFDARIENIVIHATRRCVALCAAAVVWGHR